MARQCVVTGTHLWSLTPDVLAGVHAGLVAGLETGVLSPVIAAELPFEDAAKAHAMVMEPGATGKIVLVADVPAEGRR